jgi:hypothetical protein
LEFVLTGRILICWTASRIEAADVEEIDTVVKLLYLKSGDAIPCRITVRQPDDQVKEFIQQERLIESNHAIAAAISAAHQPPEKKAQPALAPPEINDTLLWHVQQTLSDQLDPKLKSAPSASLVFTCYCRDKMTLAEMHRRFHWPLRTLKLRKATLQAFLRKQFNLELAAFFVDRSIFGAVERQLADHRARHISPRALADAHDPQDAA